MAEEADLNCRQTVGNDCELTCMRNRQCEPASEYLWEGDQTVPAENKFRCRSCQSDNQSAFNGEIALHFPGLDGLNKPIVWAFSEVAVCLDCGFSQFIVRDHELNVLRTGSSWEQLCE
jgi:hypothetical protein